MSAKHVRTVELQLLRHGPPHNQLLSPLTDYLALCGDHTNTTLNFPLEHLSLVVRLRALRYQDSEETRKTQLHETAQMVANMFASVPGLISELGRRDSKSESLVHLSIATTASELSLVPFELATSPPGFPGSGANFCLQTEFPVCITRRSRQVRFAELQWNTPVRILFVVADPMRLKLPLIQHVEALVKVVEPWFYPATKSQAAQDKTILEINRVLKANQKESKSFNDPIVHSKQLTILMRATAAGISRTIREAIAAQTPYSHVHILAHGCELPNQPESSGVALHMEQEKEATDVMDGQRLGQALTVNRAELEANEYRSSAQEPKLHPLVVTLAVCDSGRTSSDMAKPGSSVGFHVHEARIPFVVCSQFPLSHIGSVIFTEGLYRRLLDGVDPRICLWEARRELFALQQERKTTSDSSDMPSSRGRGRHDWASIIAFAALPLDIDQQALQFQRSQQRRRMELTLAEGDDLWLAHRRHRMLRVDVEAFIGLARAEVARFDDFIDQRTSDSSDYTDLLGISASANKRFAEFVYSDERNGDDTDDRDRWLKHIRQSYRRYLAISRRDANRRWAFVQRLFLKWFLTLYQVSSLPNSQSLPFFTGSDDTLRKEWVKTAFLCQEPVDAPNPQEQIWHLTDKLELGLMCWLIFPKDDPSDVDNIWDKDVIKLNLQTLDRIALAGSENERFAAYSGRRQLLRYRRFANMFYSEPNMFYSQARSSTKNDTSAWRRQSKQWGQGYDAFKKSFPDFAAIFEEVEQLIFAQIEMEQ